jgi:hypothetical protein
VDRIKEQKDILRKTVTVPFLSFYSCPGSGRSLDSSQVRVTAITETTGNCTLEARPLFQINNTTSTVHKLFIYSESKYYNFFCKYGVIWPFNTLYYQILAVQSEVLMNLEKHEEYRPMTSASD